MVDWCYYARQQGRNFFKGYGLRRVKQDETHLFPTRSNTEKVYGLWALP
jgi:hypothetical protein